MRYRIEIVFLRTISWRNLDYNLDYSAVVATHMGKKIENSVMPLAISYRVNDLNAESVEDYSYLINTCDVNYSLLEPLQ